MKKPDRLTFSDRFILIARKMFWMFFAGPMLFGLPSGFGSEPQVLLFVETSGTSPY